MASYSALPKVVQAAKILSIGKGEASFDVGDGRDDWLRKALGKQVGEQGAVWVLNGGIRIGTLEGTMRAEAGDYVVQGVRGEVYAVRGDIFNETYRPLTP